MYFRVAGYGVDEAGRIIESDHQDFYNAFCAFILSEKDPKQNEKIAFNGLLRKYHVTIDSTSVTVLFTSPINEEETHSCTVDDAAEILQIKDGNVIALVQLGKLDVCQDSRRISFDSIDRYARERTLGYLLTKPKKVG